MSWELALKRATKSYIFTFGTSNLLSTYRKTSLILHISVHLVLSSLKIQRRVIPTKYTASFFHSVWKETSPKPWKVPTAKVSFSSVYVKVTICFDNGFLFHVTTRRHCFYKSLLIPWGLFSHNVRALNK